MLNTQLAKKDLLGIKDLSAQEIISILDRADFWAQRFKEDPKLPEKPLEGKFISNLFFEPSTRTRFSFELAAKRLGAEVLNFYPRSSSTQKGETIYDTLKTLEAMGVNTAVIRHSEEGFLENLSSKLNISIVNAGTGTTEHPSQALLDLLTMRQEFGEGLGSFPSGLKVAIIGDIVHSRVASSNIQALEKLGAELYISGPDIFMLDGETHPHLKVVSVDEAVSEADIVMMLRVQKERHSKIDSSIDFALSTDGQVMTDTEYPKSYGLSVERAKLMKPQAKIMHPGPFNRGVEIDASLVESDKSLIYKQVENGVFTRMAILEGVQA